MLITFLMIGPTSEKFISEGYRLFAERLKHYCRFREIVIPDLKDRKSLTPLQIKEQEARLLLTKIPEQAFVVLLDEHGKEFTSVDFATFLQKTMNTGCREIVFVIGGAFGVANMVNEKANMVISLSQMTFTHQFIRVMLAEQVYRAMTILRNEPYHND